MRLPVGCLLSIISLGACVPECGEREHRAELDMKNIADAVNVSWRNHGQVPRSLDQIFCPDGGEGCPLKDPWGTPYELQATDAGFVIRSAGRDHRWDTADDLTITLPSH